MTSPDDFRQIKLISVTFKEAALDSPSFRASINHIDDQIDNIEKWVIALSSSVKKFPKYLEELQSFSNSFLEHLVPLFIQDGLIDQEYTVQSLTTTGDGLKRLWGTSLAAMNVKSSTIDRLHSRVIKDINNYKELRARFEMAQNKYDKYLEIYLSSSKTKNPTIVMEDMAQLFQVRRDYIHESLEVVIQLTRLGNLLDKLLVRFSTDFWKEKKQIFTDWVDTAYKEEWEKIQKIQNWSDCYASAIGKINKDLHQARYQVEQSSSNQYQPSTNADDYNVSLINGKSLLDSEEVGFEKHGYLFMKTYVEKSAKPVWVRRWGFIKNGVFGLLMLSPSKKFVQESDKIGILLCKIQYAPNEDRRFCFEIKTVDITIVFQVDTLKELKSWLRVFENERTRISDSQDAGLFNIASGRYPPILTEFASTANTSMDRELTSARIVNSVGQIITSSKLSSHIEKNEAFFRNHIYYQIPQIRPPFITDTTRSSIIGYSIADATSLPTALTANIWGSVNWGLYYLNDYYDAKLTDLDRQRDIELESETDSYESGIHYPLGYPDDLVLLDIQMRALFEVAVEAGEICLVSFRCICSPNSKQDLSGRSFITKNHIYFYIQESGFISLLKRHIGSIVSVEYSRRKHNDLLKIYNVKGVMTMKLFLDDGNLIRQKLMHIMNNRISDNPKRNQGLVTDLVEIETQYYKAMTDARENVSNNENTTTIIPSVMVSNDENRSMQFKVNYRDESYSVLEGTYNLPPKAIFHALLGDNSIILDGKNAFTSLGSIIKMPWSKLPNGKLHRKFNSPTIYEGRNRGELQFEQNIESMVDDEYYNFTHVKSSYKFLGCKFSINYRFVITRLTYTQSKFFVYAKTECDKCLVLSKMIQAVCHRLCINQAKALDVDLKNVVKKVGTHGMIVKAIYLYGKLTQYEQYVDEVKPIPVVKIRVLGVISVIVRQFLFYNLLIISGLFHFIANLVITIARGIRMNYALLFILLLSILFNFFLMGKTSYSYWIVRSASKLADEHLHSKPMMLQRAIYLRDATDMLESIHVSQLHVNSTSSPCFDTFKNTSFVLNYDKTTSWKNEYADESTREVARGLKKTFQEIGVKRHDLLVKLRMLNEMETEIAKAEWRNWLMSELQRCDYINDELFKTIKADANEKTYSEMASGISSVESYCECCSAELKNLDLL
ncbi:uncharacterized protein AC631_00025 [Debaryomyces fabryi]|uniref:PH domain-containing protein n=1 Tax=Debaryomyces fabryi TaxID=58627 RepID=A0A0V1Q718_9ASCO|nr:uncharacterized protein AC631_00025 [Debaryomyces fabryi]KSA04154.1 hypothetical protein AC631_00025 [Debaryomyces fabryi]CUM46210.1 unnamed protein product [Debaryomyces fabryi]